MKHTSSVFPASGLFTDMYQLTMAQGYFLDGRKNELAAFDYFFRKIPFRGGYVVFAGLDDLLNFLEELRFTEKELDYLRMQGFDEKFVAYLSDFQFRGTVRTVREGEIVFPNEPVLVVTGNLIECQLIETLVLNQFNFQSLIATKASRIKSVAGDKLVLDFGLRRAHSLGGYHASRAAYIGGVDATSNVYAGFNYDIPISGTQAHSWIQSFESELEAFRAFAKTFPENTTLLVDTYDTLKSGVPNAIKVAGELEERGHRLNGIRLDSGDLAYLSKKARQMLDEAGFSYVKIFASNQLDEFVIRSLNEQDAKIEGFGVGTNLITGQPDSALDGVYKLSMVNNRPTLKISENVEKVTLPGLKKLIRFTDESGEFLIDGVFIEEEEKLNALYHPLFPEKNRLVGQLRGEDILHLAMENGKRILPVPKLEEIRDYKESRLNSLPEEYKRFEFPHIFKIGISEGLLNLRKHLLEKHKGALKSD